MEDGSMDGIVSARNWVSLTQSWHSGSIAANDNDNNVNSVMVVKAHCSAMAQQFIVTATYCACVCWRGGNCFCMQTKEAVVATASF